MAFPIFLIDVDDVMVDWSANFHSWMLNRGHRRDPEGLASWNLCHSYSETPWPVIKSEIDGFAKSEAYRDIPLIEGVLETITAIRLANGEVHAVTCCGNDPAIVANRRHQLRDLPLSSIITLEMDESKASAYGKFLPGVVIDDAPKHISVARVFSHRAIVYDRPHNQDCQADGRMMNWEFAAIRLLQQVNVGSYQ